MFTSFYSFNSNMDIQLKAFLEEQVDVYNRPGFKEEDPISIPHRFKKIQDIEIVALWTALIAWGQRKTILKNASQLVEWMDYNPHQFIVQHQEKDRQRFETFVHRTFNAEDAFVFLEYFQNYYREKASLEDAFADGMGPEDPHVGPALVHFKADFKSRVPYAGRTLRHIASPETGSRCKRLLMFLRWMVRKDDRGVDFGIWKRIKPSQLLLPLDVHVETSSRKLGLLKRTQSDWKAVLELSAQCARLDPEDPCRYDFALFGIGISAKSRNFNI